MYISFSSFNRKLGPLKCIQPGKEVNYWAISRRNGFVSQIQNSSLSSEEQLSPATQESLLDLIQTDL